MTGACSGLEVTVTEKSGAAWRIWVTCKIARGAGEGNAQPARASTIPTGSHGKQMRLTEVRRFPYRNGHDRSLLGAGSYGDGKVRRSLAYLGNMQDRPWRRGRECTARQGEHNPNRITWQTDAPDGSQAFSVPERT